MLATDRPSLTRKLICERVLTKTRQDLGREAGEKNVATGFTALIEPFAFLSLYGAVEYSAFALLAANLSFGDVVVFGHDE